MITVWSGLVAGGLIIGMVMRIKKLIQLVLVKIFGPALLSSIISTYNL